VDPTVHLGSLEVNYISQRGISMGMLWDVLVGGLVKMLLGMLLVFLYVSNRKVMVAAA